MAKIRETIISNCEKNFVKKCYTDYLRLDGRSFDEFRELKIEFSRDWGCCYVSLGKTRVLAQVSCEIQQPKSSRPSEGILNVNIELSPMGAPHFEAGRQSDLSVQLNRILEKCIKDSKAIDLESLCIKVNEKVWGLRVDVNVLNHEGNIIDCASVAALTALAHFRRPDVSSDGEEITIHTYAQRDPIPTVVHHYPVCISYGLFSEGDVVMADPTLLEEGVADAHLTVGLNAYKELCGLHLTGSSLMTPENIIKCTSKAGARVNTVVKLIQNALEKDKQDRIQNIKPTFETSSQFEITVNTLEENLELYLDRYVRKKSKKEKRNLKKEQAEANKETARIEVLSNGSAALIPTEPEVPDIWIASSDDDSEIEYVAPPKPEPPLVLSSGGESEEEQVVVLNSNKKSKKKKMSTK